jgi:hypothetical protein
MELEIHPYPLSHTILLRATTILVLKNGTTYEIAPQLPSGRRVDILWNNQTERLLPRQPEHLTQLQVILR